MVFVLIRMRVLTPYDNLPISVALECVHSAPSLLVRRVPITHILPVAGSSVAPAKSGSAREDRFLCKALGGVSVVGGLSRR